MIKVLVIENEDDVRGNIIELLEAEGFEAIAAVNGQQGLQLALHCSPQLILCDILMPGLNGYDVLAALRQHHQGAAIPFLFLSAKVSEGDRQQGLDLGANCYIQKPFAIAHLLEAIRTCLGQTCLGQTGWVEA